MRRSSVPRPRDGRRKSTPKGKSNLNTEGDLNTSQTDSISEENKEISPDNDNKDSPTNVDTKKSDVSKIDSEVAKNDDDTELDESKNNKNDDGDTQKEKIDDNFEDKEESVVDGQNEANGENDSRTITDQMPTNTNNAIESVKDTKEANKEAQHKDNAINDTADAGVDVTDNEVDEELITEEENIIMSEKELEEEWKKLTEDPNYPSLQTVDHLTTSRPNPPINQTPLRDDVTRLTNHSVNHHVSSSAYYVPPLQLPESVRWTQQPAPTYTSNRTLSEIPYSSFSYQHKHPIRVSQNTSRRHSIPKPLPSSKDPYSHNNQNTEHDFMDDNAMLVSARKLDSLLFRLFYKTQHLQAWQNYTKTKQEKNTVENENTPSVSLFEHSGSDIISMDPVTWQLRPMGAVQKEALQSELPYLEENLDSKEIIRKLFMDGIITHQDYNQLTHTEGQGGKAVIRLLIGTLQRRGERAYPALMQTLKDLGLNRVHDKLKSTEMELSRGMEDDRDELERRTRMEGMGHQSVLPSHRPSTLGQDFSTIDTQTFHHPTPTDQRLHTIPSARPSPSPPKEPSQPPTEGNSARVSNREEYDREVEKQLTELNAELKALHEDINNLRSSRASVSQDGTQAGDNSSKPSQQVPQKSSSCILL